MSRWNGKCQRNAEIFCIGQQNRIVTWFFSNNAVFVMVEARGIEPLSKKHLQRFSTSVADNLRFPRHSVCRQTLRFGSLWVMTESKAHFRSRSPLIDAPAKPWYSQQERSLIKQRGQQFYCCRLILKSADFIAVLQCRCPLAEAHTPCRNLYAPKLNGKLKRENGKLLTASFF